MKTNPIAILGIPLDNLTMEETIESIFSMIEEYFTDKRPRQICTVNTDFVANTLPWNLSKTRHPELLDILRKADLVTADGMPLVWISRFIGVPLKNRVTGADLVPELAREASLRHKSIYFLGGKGNVAIQAAQALKKLYPDLIIAGCDSPFVHIEGEPFLDALESDFPIVERINASGADILLIAFGNPKQELWFERNRHRLKVPVSIGIGGTFEFIAGKVARAPIWMQRNGMEWIFRLIQDPRRLWKRYLIDLIEIGLLIWPGIIYYQYKKAFSNKWLADKTNGDTRSSIISEIDTGVYIVSMPKVLDAASSNDIINMITSPSIKRSSLVLDLNNVIMIDSSGIGLLSRLCSHADMKFEDVYMIGLTPSLQRFFSYNRILNLYKHMIYNNTDEVLRVILQRPNHSPLNSIN